jgi:hypothetical protein
MSPRHPPKDRNLLDLKPVRLMEHTEAEGRVSVLVPRFRSRWLGFLQRRLRKPCVQLHLDEVGSAVWLACDGQRSVGQIGQALQERFGPQLDPIWDRLGLFVRHLHRGQLIALDD